MSDIDEVVLSVERICCRYNMSHYQKAPLIMRPEKRLNTDKKYKNQPLYKKYLENVKDV